MKRTGTQLILVLVCAYFAVDIANAADSGLGVWTDNDEKHTYAFLKNNELKLWGQLSKWDQHTKQTNYAPGKVDGVWKSGDNICWLGEKRQQVGNLMMYADSLQCCMSAQFLGSKLVLSEVWQKGTDNLGICTNRVLKRARETPDQRDARVKAEHERETAQRNIGRQEAEKECPDTYHRYLEMEKKYGQPQLWQGCNGAYY